MDVPRNLLRDLRLPYLVLGFLLAAGGLTAAREEPRDGRPNIIFILADDLSWSDLGVYGSGWHDTPHLDRLAREGLRFTSAYAAAPICSASRAAILTGRSPARLHFEFVTKPEPGSQPGRHALRSPPYTLNLPLDEVTVAEKLRNAGYRTGFFGKWHVSQHHKHYLGWSPTHGPLQQGFDEGDPEFGSHPYGYESTEAAEERRLAEGAYPDDALTERAIEFLRAHRDRPFFLYLSHYYVHTPVHTRAKWLQKLHQAELPENRAAYAAMVQTLDDLVGRVMNALDAMGLAENTLVVFTSDNGGHPEFAANGPFRGSKWNVYEGGLRVPFLVRWPGRIEAGRTNGTPIIGTDLLPTFCEAAGVAHSPDRELDGRSLLPLWLGREHRRETRSLIWHFPYYHPEPADSFARALEEIGTNDFRTSQTRPQSAIRHGDYKLIWFAESDSCELYDISKDAGEQTDLSTIEPEKARLMKERLDDYLSEVRARLAVRVAQRGSVRD